MEDTSWMLAPCRESTWPKNIKGYAKRTINGQQYLHHRFVYEQRYGPIPNNMDVCHHCDNPPCIEISHLFLATNADNVKDSVKKGRRAVGENSGKSKLTSKEVEDIRELGLEFTQDELAEIFKVGKSTIGNILRRETWKHI